MRIKLTDKGREVGDAVDALYQKHVRTVEQVGGINTDEFGVLNKALHRLERFWTDQIFLSPVGGNSLIVFIDARRNTLLIRSLLTCPRLVLGP